MQVLSIVLCLLLLLLVLASSVMKNPSSFAPLPSSCQFLDILGQSKYNLDVNDVLYFYHKEFSDLFLFLREGSKIPTHPPEKDCFNFTWGCKSISIYYSVTACISLGNRITHVMSMQFGICPHQYGKGHFFCRSKQASCHICDISCRTKEERCNQFVCEGHAAHLVWCIHVLYFIHKIS